jgi:hypothetical protein
LGRRRFDHLYVALSVAAGVRLPRYELWMDFQEHGCNPERLSASEALAWIDRAMDGFLDPQGCSLALRRRHRLRRDVARFDPTFATPEERIAALVLR